MSINYIKHLKKTILVGKGLDKADLVLKNAQIVNVFTNEIIKGDVAITNGTVCGVGENYLGYKEIDIQGKYLGPGLIDSHVHIESTMVTPIQFSNTVLPRGTTTIISDPHEIANVSGIKGIQYLIECSQNIPLDVYFMAPSCVPATTFETAGSSIDTKDIETLMENPKVLGLGELMNYPGLLSGDDEILNKLYCTKDKIQDGHAPFVNGKNLNGYIASGIKTDHECSTIREMTEKLRLGMYIQIREGSAAKNLEVLINGVTKDNISRCLFCTDDRHLEDIFKKGHIDNCIRMAIKKGISPIDSIKMATINSALCYGLKNKGAIAPGYIADIIVFDNLSDFNIEKVYKEGILVAENKVILNVLKVEYISPAVLNTVNAKKPVIDDFKLKLDNSIANVISIIPNELITNKVSRKVDIENGHFKYGNNNILKLAVIERHKKTGNIGLGLVENYGLKNGAIATTIGHDSHNIIVIGDNDLDMYTATCELISNNGGISVCQKGEVLKTIPLPIGGLMSDKPAIELNNDLKEILEIVRCLDVNPEIEPFITLSFLALPVIPEIRLTDKGLFDVTTFSFIET